MEIFQLQAFFCLFGEKVPSKMGIFRVAKSSKLGRIFIDKSIIWAGGFPAILDKNHINYGYIFCRLFKK